MRMAHPKMHFLETICRNQSFNPNWNARIPLKCYLISFRYHLVLLGSYDGPNWFPLRHNIKCATVFTIYISHSINIWKHFYTLCCEIVSNISNEKKAANFYILPTKISLMQQQMQGKFRYAQIVANNARQFSVLPIHIVFYTFLLQLIEVSNDRCRFKSSL